MVSKRETALDNLEAELREIPSLTSTVFRWMPRVTSTRTLPICIVAPKSGTTVDSEVGLTTEQMSVLLEVWAEYDPDAAGDPGWQVLEDLLTLIQAKVYEIPDRGQTGHTETVFDGWRFIAPSEQAPNILRVQIDLTLILRYRYGDSEDPQ